MPHSTQHTAGHTAAHRPSSATPAPRGHRSTPGRERDGHTQHTVREARFTYVSNAARRTGSATRQERD